MYCLLLSLVETSSETLHDKQNKMDIDTPPVKNDIEGELASFSLESLTFLETFVSKTLCAVRNLPLI